MGQRIMRIYFKQLGGHTHMRVFSGIEGFTLGKAGDLCFTNEEFRELKKRERLRLPTCPGGLSLLPRIR